MSARIQCETIIFIKNNATRIQCETIIFLKNQCYAHGVVGVVVVVVLGVIVVAVVAVVVVAVAIAVVVSGDVGIAQIAAEAVCSLMFHARMLE